MRVLIIRSLEDALSMITVLQSKGIVVSHHPLFKPHFLPIPPLLNPAALIVTSKNAIRALKDADELKGLPLYSVGDKTAELAKQYGFLKVASASGASQDLIKLIVKIPLRSKGILWYLSGEKITRNITDSLNQEGFKAKRQIVYRIEDALDLPETLCHELKNHTLSHVLLCSSRTTAVFVDLLKKKKLEMRTCQITALCLSEEIKEKALDLQWKELWLSPKPNINNLMGYFDGER